MMDLATSEGHCCMLDYIRIAYYPRSNRITSGDTIERFPVVKRTKIDDMTSSECRELTGLSSNQLKKLFLHLRFPNRMVYPRRYSCSGEESFLHFMVYLRLGETKLRMSTNYFGGDPRRFTYTIRMVTNHIYSKFYHKISGDSMRMWIEQITDFRHAIWSRLSNGGSIEEASGNDRQNNSNDQIVFLSIPRDSFRIFGFLDDTGFRTTAPGRSLRRRYGYNIDIQRSFYSGYFSGHGLKVQAVTLPNGMFGSVYIGSLRVSDCGLQNMSGLDTYLCALFREYDMSIDEAENQFPAVYGDGVFPQLSTIVARYSHPNIEQARINSRMSSVRQSIEHIFALHRNTFGLFSIPYRLKLLLNGVHVKKITLVSFFLLNCFTCFNETGYFDVRPPTIEEYLPLGEILRCAPDIQEDETDHIFNYDI